jgi:hypothetical protein
MPPKNVVFGVSLFECETIMEQVTCNSFQNYYVQVLSKFQCRQLNKKLLCHNKCFVNCKIYVNAMFKISPTQLLCYQFHYAFVACDILFNEAKPIILV